MATIGWNEAAPADTDNAGRGDDEIRSLKTSLRQGLDDEHVWFSAGGDSGLHRRGSAKVYYGTQSAVSSVGTDAKLMLTSDTSRLFAVGSGGTVFLGGWGSLSVDSTSDVTWPQRARWACEFGHADTGGFADSARVAYPNSGFSGRPFVVASLVSDQPVTLSRFDLRISLSQTTGFTFSVVNTVGGTAIGEIDWISIGTRAL